MSNKGVQQPTLRERAMPDSQGSERNPSMLGDPVSPKAETSERTPTDTDMHVERGGGEKSDGAANTSVDPNKKAQNGGHETLREKAMGQLHGDGANPSMLGDPISMKAETEDKFPREAEEGGMGSGKSKL